MIFIRIYALLALGLHLLAYALPEDTFWSVWPYTVLPLWLGALLAGLAALLTVPGLNTRVQQIISQLWVAIPGKAYPRRWFSALAIFSLPLFWLFRIRHLNWGDAQILVIGLAHPDLTVIYNWQAPFTVFLHQRLWALVVDPYFGAGVDTVYALVSALCGGVFVYVTLRLAQDLGQNTLERALIAGFVLTSGSMQLFFGYVENYTIISLGIIIFLWLSLKVLRNEAPLWSAILALSLTNAFHPSTVILWPAALYLSWRVYRSDAALPKLLLDLLLPPLIVASSALTLMELGDHGLQAFLGDDRPGGGDHIWFVPLTLDAPNQWQQYTMFSLPHFVDWANLHVLILVFGLITLIIGGGAIKAEGGRMKGEDKISSFIPHPSAFVRFLAVASAMYLLFTWVWNADYGMRKDWDLFSPAAFVYSVLAALLLIRALKEKAALAQATLLIILISALHTAAWVLSNMTR
ncbi:MAG TPA: hypothetical protein G4N96_06050 [Chloroflexi bacterium]|nr:hypothetical protein [Chloroflexota bacterium]